MGAGNDVRSGRDVWGSALGAKMQVGKILRVNKDAGWAGDEAVNAYAGR